MLQEELFKKAEEIHQLVIKWQQKKTFSLTLDILKTGCRFVGFIEGLIEAKAITEEQKEELLALAFPASSPTPSEFAEFIKTLNPDDFDEPQEKGGEK